MQLELSEISQEKIKAVDRGCTENKPIFGRVLKASETLPFEFLVKVDNGVVFPLSCCKFCYPALGENTNNQVLPGHNFLVSLLRQEGTYPVPTA